LEKKTKLGREVFLLTVFSLQRGQVLCRQGKTADNLKKTNKRTWRGEGGKKEWGKKLIRKYLWTINGGVCGTGGKKVLSERRKRGGK